jgi:hypothetical protein
MPTSVEAYIEPIQKRVKTKTLIAMVEVGLMVQVQGLDTMDREGFLVMCKEIGRRAFM